MKKLPIDIQQRIDRYQSVTVDGITVWPVTVENMYLFGAARAALDVVPLSLPVALMSLPVLDAFYRLDLDEIKTNGKARGLLASAMLLLRLALRLGAGTEDAAALRDVRIVPDKRNPDRLEAVYFTGRDGETIRVTPVLFQRLRPVLAAQNGVDMPSDTANPEILEAERLLAEKDLRELEPTLIDKIIFVAQGCGVSEEKVWQWPILKLERNAALLRRRLDYLAVTTGQMSGMVNFKDGNPVPSPYWPRKRSLASLQALSAVGNGAAEAAVRNAQQSQTPGGRPSSAALTQHEQRSE